MKKIVLFLACLNVGNALVAGTPHLNLFNPYDWLMTPPERPCGEWELEIGYEALVGQHAYQADEDSNGISKCFRKRADALQLYQNEQDLLAALKGPGYQSALAQLSQQFNIDDDDGSQGLFIPCGKFDLTNVMFSAYRYLPYGFIFSMHLPLLFYKLKNVIWNAGPNNTNKTFESQIVANGFVAAVGQVGNINFYDWEQTGVGDFAALIRWGRHFPQARPLLSNVYLGWRVGLTLPTGKLANQNVLLGLPLGNNASVGILLAATLELLLRNYYLFGVDVELFHLFGRTFEQRIKTDFAQTDLTFLNETCTYHEPGFTQHYTLYWRGYLYDTGFYGQISYQYTKQQETFLFLTTDAFNPAIANSAESNFSWTTHSIIYALNYDLYDEQCHSKWPFLSLMYKQGFNGSRAIAADTLTAVVTVTF